MKFNEIIKKMAEVPWAIVPSALEDLVARIHARLEGGEVAKGARKAKVPDSQRLGSVAVIPVYGAITHRADFWTDYFDLPTAEGIRAQILTAVGDQEISSIVLDINSPGGTVPGIPELGAAMQEARKAKRIVAVANSMAASAAYWIGASASELAVIPSGQVGSVGVFAMHEDMSGALERWGSKITIVSAGKYKTEGHPYGPLTDEAKKFMQQRVDTFYGMFIDALAAGRGVPAEKVRAGFGEGRTVLASDAVKNGMADRVATMDNVLAQEILRARRVSGSGPRAQIKTVRDFEDFLRDAGSFSNAEAKRIASAGFRGDAAEQDLRDGGGEPGQDQTANALRDLAKALGNTTSTEKTA